MPLVTFLPYLVGMAIVSLALVAIKLFIKDVRTQHAGFYISMVGLLLMSAYGINSGYVTLSGVLISIAVFAVVTAASLLAYFRLTGSGHPERIASAKIMFQAGSVALLLFLLSLYLQTLF